MKMSGAKALIEALEREGVTTVFGYPGAANGPIYDELSKAKIIKHILTRHEQAAAHAASGFARATGKVGVCMATSGPGATNLITGIATAYMDSIPIVAITGQVPTDLIGRDVFQEVDITGATEPFCKHSYLVKDEKDIVRIVREAFYIAGTGRPGPVLIDIPIDLQINEVDFAYPEKVEIRGYNPTHEGHELQLEKVVNAINEAEKPLICAGGGVIRANASEELVELIDKTKIPVITTLMGIGAIPGNHPMNLGLMGSHGVFSANEAVSESDLLIIMGARAGDRATGNTDKFAKGARIIHIDIDPAEIGKNLGTDIPVVGNIKNILKQLTKHLKNEEKKEWIEAVKEWKQTVIDKEALFSENNNIGYVNPKYTLKMLTKITEGKAIVTTEVGQNQIWTANNYKPAFAGAFLTSGGLGTMGYGLPAAIGAKIGAPDKTVFVVAGDGSFQMNLPELATINQWDVEVKIILFNNSRLGMVRELQKNKFDSNYFATILDGNPDFIKLAAAYDIPAERITDNSEVEDAINRAIKHNGTYLIEFIVDPEENTL